MTDDVFLDGLIRDREGEALTDAAGDRGGLTKFGITARELGRWRHLGRPATRLEMRAFDQPEARAIYHAWYLAPFAWVGDEPLRWQLADFGVNSGPTTAVRCLQHVLGVAVDGLVGPRTQAALVAADPRLVNNALVAARCRFLNAIVDSDPTQVTFLHGWIRRACGFFA